MYALRRNNLPAFRSLILVAMALFAFVQIIGTARHAHFDDDAPNRIGTTIGGTTAPAADASITVAATNMASHHHCLACTLMYAQQGVLGSLPLLAVVLLAACSRIRFAVNLSLHGVPVHRLPFGRAPPTFVPSFA